MADWVGRKRGGKEAGREFTAKLGRIYEIALVLAKSQLRATRSGRGGESLFRNAAIIAVIDVALFVICALVGYEVSQAIRTLPQAQATSVVTVLSESLVFIPALIPSVVLIAGILFELSTPSKFASSDSINWLPVTQAEYVAASTLSVAYTYSVVPSLIWGLTLMPSVEFGLGWTWAEMLVLSCIALFYGGAIVEIMRAAINRVSTVIMRRARRGALVLRLAVTVGVILALQVVFNFVFLIDLVNRFASTLNVVAFLPVLWASLAIRESLTGNYVLSAGYFGATALFAVSMLWIAIRVRAKYWSPMPSQIIVTRGDYVPGGRSRLGIPLFGLDALEVAMVRKDLKGLARRRELLQYFSIPFVLGVVFLLQLAFNPAVSSGPPGAQRGFSVIDQLPVWFVGGLFGLIISSISFGQEQKSAPLLYFLPVTAKEVLHAKMFISLLLALVATLSIFIVVTILSRPPPLIAAESLLVGIAIAVEEVCIGTAFGARYPDFQERPRPRFMDPLGILIMGTVGMTLLLVTALPSILSDTLTSQVTQSQVQSLFLLSLAFAVAVIGLAYSWAGRQTRKLLAEFHW